VHKLADVPLDDPDVWATTWRAYQRKRARREASERVTA